MYELYLISVIIYTLWINMELIVNFCWKDKLCIYLFIPYYDFWVIIEFLNFYLNYFLVFQIWFNMQFYDALYFFLLIRGLHLALIAILFLFFVLLFYTIFMILIVSE